MQASQTGGTWRTAKGCAHAQDAELRCRPCGNLIAATSVSGSLVRRVGVVEDVAFHQVEHVEEPA